MTGTAPWTRRRALAAGASLLGVGLAGCIQEGGSTPTPRSPIVGTSFDGPDLVVELEEGHEVSQLNLIGPDGSLYESTNILQGVKSVRLQILDILPGPGFKHYTPGIQTLVATGANRIYEVEINLYPELRLVKVEQFRGGDGAYDLGRVSVTVDNIGTGPTWIYALGYRDAPNWAANHGLGGDPGSPQLRLENNPENLIIQPGKSKTFVSATVPLLFPEDAEPDCGGSAEFTVLVGQAMGSPLEQRVRVSLGGEIVQVGLTNEYTCSLVTYNNQED